MLILRADLKKIVYDSVEKKFLKHIIYIVFSGILIFVMLYYSLSSLSIVEVTLMLNTVGLKVAVIAYFALGDRLTLVEVGCLLLAFSGVVTLILGAETKEIEHADAHQPTIWAYLVCLLACIFIAC